LSNFTHPHPTMKTSSASQRSACKGNNEKGQLTLEKKLFWHAKDRPDCYLKTLYPCGAVSSGMVSVLLYKGSLVRSPLLVSWPSLIVAVTRPILYADSTTDFLIVDPSEKNRQAV